MKISLTKKKELYLKESKYCLIKKVLYWTESFIYLKESFISIKESIIVKQKVLFL